MDGTIPPLLVGVVQAAEALALQSREVWRLIGRGELEAVRIGRRRLVPVDALHAYVQRLRDEAARERAAFPAEGEAA